MALGGFAALVVAGAAAAGQVDLDAAGCPTEFPEPATKLGFWIALEEDGRASDCRIGTERRDTCGNAYDSREGFLCVGFDPLNRPGWTSANGPLSEAVQSLTVDGVVAKPVYGYTWSIVYMDYGTGPSGNTWDVVIEKVVGETIFTVTINLTKTSHETEHRTMFKVNSIEITYPN